MRTSHRLPVAMRAPLATLLAIPFVAPSLLHAQPAARASAASSATASTQSAPARDTSAFARLSAGLRFRSIGPALTSGRIADVVVDPADTRVWYVGTAAGGVWKTVNAGTSFTPVFDGEGSFTIGAMALDPRTPHTVWVGTGENNVQRVVAYGDGVYKSSDGGRSWTNVGLKESEHIGRIVVDPRNSEVVYVASQGPLHRKGGERGLYKTTDGGKSWSRILHVDDWTGANDVQIDPRNPDVLLASTWQRQRRTCCFVAGGPGSGVHRSTDGGKTWTRSQRGLPTEEMGRIGLAVSPANPDVVYAVVEAAVGRSGFYRSRDGGVSWERMSATQSGSNYYNEIVADPKNPDRVYLMDVLVQVSDDGGRTFRRLGEFYKHVDNHSIWIDPAQTDHVIVGSDGGVYESHDRGRSWRFVANLPVTQFYRVTVDDLQPFYRVFGGTQDNFSLAGPSRTRTNNGIRNADWFITSGGDGFGSVADPSDPNTVYAQSQFGVLSRFNLATGDVMGIQPEDAAGGPGFRWNWDSPIIVSPHSPSRLYFAAERVLRSDDRGNSWRVVSPDLSRNIDRTRLRMMDRVQGVDAVARNASTTLFGNVFTLHESPLKEGLLVAGTNDGRVSITEDGGTTWRSIDRFPGVPDTTHVTRVVPSQHDVNTLYATFNNYQSGDFAPYVLQSTDLGRTWRSIASNLPARGSVWAIAEDHVDRDLLFVGTEFGVFASRTGGASWTQLKGGLPTIQVRDIAIQKRHNDLVIATFGRGFYVLDDYSSLRSMRPERLTARATIFPIRPAPLFVQSSPLGLPGPSFQGAGHFLAENPPYGALITYAMRDSLVSRRVARQRADASVKTGDATIPTWEALKAEDREEEPAVIVEISDAAGRPVRRFPAPASTGLHRVAWDLRYQPTNPVNGAPYQFDVEFPFSSPPLAPFALPGRYTVKLWARVDGAMTPLSETATVDVVEIDSASRRSPRTPAILAEQLRSAELVRAVLGTDALVNQALGTMGFLTRAIDETPTADTSLVRQARALTSRLRDLSERLNGDPTRGRRNEHSPPALMNRLMNAIGQNLAQSLEAPTAAQSAQVEIVRAAFGEIRAEAQRVVEVELKALEAAAERAGVPWTAGRVPGGR